MSTFEQLHAMVIDWGCERNIIPRGEVTYNPAATQTLKLGSEFGELCDNIAKGRYDRAHDDIGDMVVVLIMISQIIGTDLETCLDTAWNDIKDRTGYLNEHGVFIKAGDV